MPTTVAMSEYHVPVLLQESIDALNLQANGVYVDVTFGGGGHSTELLNQLEGGRLIAFDRDDNTHENRIDDERITYVDHDYRWISNFLEYNQAVPVNGILADLGVSSHQFNTAERGFSFRWESELDMRMDRDIQQTAADVLNQYPERQLQTIFAHYGEVKNARTLAGAIVTNRKLSPFKTTGQLLDILDKTAHKSDKKSKYYSQVFQALRIEVNEELKSLELFLESVPDTLAPGGRLAVITYHSLEDRLVKNFINKGNLKGIEEKDLYGRVIKALDTVNRKPIVPSAKEIEENPRSRSAKLRIAEKPHE